MRKSLLHPWYKELSYEIREIVAIAEKVKTYGKTIVWENIGDPIQKGEQFPEWMKEILTTAIQKNEVYGYSPSRWLLKTREYLAKKNGKIQPQDIIFFNGLWEAISKLYGYLAPGSRVLGPNPAYPTHSSAEATNSASDHITYMLDPKNGWNPNLQEIENTVKENPNIVGILVINPDNPTGAIFKREILEGMIDIARRYDMFVIFDEIYEKLVYDNEEKVTLRDIIGDVPGISMKWISKELPWPGARCGRIEVYNKEKDENFSKYIDSVFAAKQLEVCSTTLPQFIIPELYEDPRFQESLRERTTAYKQKAQIVDDILGNVEWIIYVQPKGAFYVSIVFDMEKIHADYMPDIEQAELKEYVGKLIEGKRFDKKFCYTLLASTWICVVPLSGFNSSFEWFRMTLLESDVEKFRDTLERIKSFITKFQK